MNYYEQIIIIDPNLDDTAVEETVQKVRDVITKQGGEIFKTENWGRRKLAYELNKHQKGCYILLLFKAPPPTVAALEKLSKVVDSIIKFMVVKLVKKKQIEAALASVSKAEAKESAVGTPGADTKTAETGEGAPKPEGE
jgi:small subunit ribosomal protein S6